MQDFATGGDDTLSGGAGSDTLFGDAGGGIFGNASGGDDTLDGGGDNDLLIGDAIDLAFGATGGDDTLSGGGGNDVLVGDAFGLGAGSIGGDDTLIGGTGADTLTGNSGADRFDYAAGDGDTGLGDLTLADVITDFSDGVDLIGLDGLVFGNGVGEASFVDASVGFVGGNATDTALIINGGDLVDIEILAVIQGVTVANMDATDTVVV
jgi:Ca2+-binding RTX toxin-like protein